MKFVVTTNRKKIELDAKDEDEAMKVAESVLTDDEVIIMIETDNTFTL